MSALETNILELISEDDYGSWELWWRMTQLHKGENSGSLTGAFVATIENLISRGIIKAKRRTPSGQLQPAKFSPAELPREMEKSRPQILTHFYGFGRGKVGAQI